MNLNMANKCSMFFVLIHCVMLFACVGVPVQEMSDARQAIAAAKKALGENSNAVLLQAEEALQSAERALGDGAYELAKRYALSSKDLAIQAQRVLEHKDLRM